MQPRTERRVPINNTTEVTLTFGETGRFKIASVTDTNTIVLASPGGTPSTVDDMYNGLRFRREANVPAGVASAAYARTGIYYMVTDYTGGTLTVDFTPSNTAAGDFVAGDTIVMGPSLPAAFRELNIGWGASPFRFATVLGGTLRTDYMAIAAGAYRTITPLEAERIDAIYLLTDGAATDMITVEYK